MLVVAVLGLVGVVAAVLLVPVVVAVPAQEAITLDQVGDAHRPGHVRLAGERWLAVTLGDDIRPGTPVLVSEIRGTTLVVFPVDWLEPWKPTGAEGEPPQRALGGAEEEST